MISKEVLQNMNSNKIDWTNEDISFVFSGGYTKQEKRIALLRVGALIYAVRGTKFAYLKSYSTPMYSITSNAGRTALCGHSSKDTHVSSRYVKKNVVYLWNHPWIYREHMLPSRAHLFVCLINKLVKSYHK